VRRAVPGIPVTTSFTGFHPLTDYWRWAPEVDIVADDTYPESPMRQSLAHDLMRGLAGGAPPFSAVADADVAGLPAVLRRRTSR